ncbi:DUF1049 domain-containing protein [Tsuneonella sp. HG249]
MQIVRTIIWVALLVVFVAFTVLNWDKALSVHIWPELVWDTRLPAVVVVSFLLGLIPMWMIHRGTKWRLQRRISNLETAARNAAVAVPTSAAPASTTATTVAATPTAEPPVPATPVDGAPKPRDEILK